MANNPQNKNILEVKGILHNYLIDKNIVINLERINIKGSILKEDLSKDINKITKLIGYNIYSLLIKNDE